MSGRARVLFKPPKPVHPAHGHGVTVRPMSPGYVARCRCGWTGAVRGARDEAMHDAVVHETKPKGGG